MTRYGIHQLEFRFYQGIMFASCNSVKKLIVTCSILVPFVLSSTELITKHLNPLKDRTNQVLLNPKQPDGGKVGGVSGVSHGQENINKFTVPQPSLQPQLKPQSSTNLLKHSKSADFLHEAQAPEYSNSVSSCESDSLPSDSDWAGWETTPRHKSPKVPAELPNGTLVHVPGIKTQPLPSKWSDANPPANLLNNPDERLNGAIRHQYGPDMVRCIKEGDEKYVLGEHYRQVLESNDVYWKTRAAMAYVIRRLCKYVDGKCSFSVYFTAVTILDRFLSQFTYLLLDETLLPGRIDFGFTGTRVLSPQGKSNLPKYPTGDDFTAIRPRLELEVSPFVLAVVCFSLSCKVVHRRSSLELILELAESVLGEIEGTDWAEVLKLGNDYRWSCDHYAMFSCMLELASAEYYVLDVIGYNVQTSDPIFIVTGCLKACPDWVLEILDDGKIEKVVALATKMLFTVMMEPAIVNTPSILAAVSCVLLALMNELVHHASPKVLEKFGIKLPDELDPQQPSGGFGKLDAEYLDRLMRYPSPKVFESLEIASKFGCSYKEVMDVICKIHGFYERDIPQEWRLF